MTVDLENPFILLHDKKISCILEVLPLLDSVTVDRVIRCS